MKIGNKVFVLLAVIISFVSSGPAVAELKIDITRGSVEAMPIAIPTFYGASANDARLAKNITQVVSDDLVRTNLFALVDPSSFIQNTNSLTTRPSFPDWRVINAQALVIGKVETGRDGKVKVEFRLWDVLSEQQMTGLVYYTAQNNWRRVAHIVADAIYQRVTGENGYFDTRIVYIAETGSETARVKRLAIMDQDGENNKILSDGRALTLTPRFSPTLQQITYMAYYNNRPRVYLFNIDTGRQDVLGDFANMTFAPRFSPDGRKVIFSLSDRGNSNIFTMDLRSKAITQITRGSAISTAPSYSPDGNAITFESDRGGSQQIYVMNENGSNPRRISFGEGRYGTPVWSPRGDLIAFTKIHKGNFSIGIMRPDGSGERILTQARHAEGPTWSPNGRVLMFFKEREGRSKLYSIDLTGYNEREIPTPTDASDPAWSPLLP